MAVHLRSSPSQSLLLFHSAPVPPRPIGAGISWAASPRSLKRTTRRFHAAPRKVAKTSIVASGSGHGRKLLRQRAEDWSAGVPVRDISGRQWTNDDVVWGFAVNEFKARPMKP